MKRRATRAIKMMAKNFIESLQIIPWNTAYLAQ